MTFSPRPKDPPYRNQIIRDLAEKVPHCMSCYEQNEGEKKGSIVLSHSDELENHKGMGQKADDLGAYLCMRCHNVCAGLEDRHLTMEERQLKWYRAQFKSMVWLLKSGYATVKRHP